MKIVLHKNFKKQYKKLRAGEKNKFKERGNVFMHDPFHPVLNNHALNGEYAGFRSINITGDLRAVYQSISEDLAFFIAIDTHSNLFG